MNKKLTYHFINGDKKTNLFEKLIYSSFFLSELIFEKKNKNYLFKEENFKNFLGFYTYDENTIKTKTPARIFSEFFIYEFFCKKFHKDQNLKFLDIGCGDGRFSEVLAKYFVNFEYLGLDYKQHNKWKNNKSDRVKFKEIDLNFDNLNFLEKFGKFDMIFSQSALEHIKNDLSVLINLNKHFPDSLNLHLIPSTMSFMNYLTHGYRRYNYRNIKKLSQILNKDIKINNLGGYSAIKSYFNYYYDYKHLIDNKKKHPFNFLMFPDEKFDLDLIKRVIFDTQKSYPLFYAIEY